MRLRAPYDERRPPLHLEAPGALGDVDDLVHHGLQILTPPHVYLEVR